MIDPWDERLNEVLATYMDVAPREGMEARVLARVYGAQDRAPRWTWWACAGAVVACGVVLLQVRPPSLPAPPSVKIAWPRVTVVDVPRRESAVRAARPGRMPVFPTPSPLSEQERLLLALVREAPVEAGKILVAPPNRDVEAIRIEELAIAPLAAGEKEERSE